MEKVMEFEELERVWTLLVSSKNKKAAMLVSQTNPVEIELFSYVYAFFCRNKFTQPLATWVKTLKDASILNFSCFRSVAGYQK